MSGQNAGRAKFYWIGLNDIQKSGSYEWVCSVDEEFCPKTPIKFFWWSTGMPEQANKDWRCVYALFSEYLPGDFGRDGKWVKGACSDQNRFICEVKNTLFSRECDTGFQLFGDKCYYYRYFFRIKRIYKEIPL